MNPMFGMPICSAPWMIEQFRFPKSKKRRIRNKWAKRPENIRPMRKAYVFNGVIYAHPVMVQQIRSISEKGTK